jgi:hypothetical protein
MLPLSPRVGSYDFPLATASSPFSWPIQAFPFPPSCRSYLPSFPFDLPSSFRPLAASSDSDPLPTDCSLPLPPGYLPPDAHPWPQSRSRAADAQLRKSIYCSTQKIPIVI